MSFNYTLAISLNTLTTVSIPQDDYYNTYYKMHYKVLYKVLYKRILQEYLQNTPQIALQSLV